MVRATYIGEDDDFLGCKNKESYTLDVYHYQWKDQWGQNATSIVVDCQEGNKQRVQYRSIDTFLWHWDNIVHVEQERPGQPGERR